MIFRLRTLRNAFVRLCLVAAVLAPAACAPGADDVSAVRRGDEAAAAGNWDEALAEYRLAVRQGSEGGDVLARVAHTYVKLGRVDEAAEFYRRAVQDDPTIADQAASDMLLLATRAQERSDLFGAASAVEAAREFRPGVTLPELALPLARHYDASGEHGLALAYYQRALRSMEMEGDTVPEVVFETAAAFDQIGDCRRALLFYDRYRSMLRPWQRAEVDWRIGNCSYTLARELRRQGEREEALALVERTLELGQPTNVQALAWFERGEILAELGRCREAMDAFQQVEAADQTGNGPLVERARWRFDELRFVGASDRFSDDSTRTGC